MLGASFAVLVNAVIAGLFAASFGLIAFAQPTRRAGIWFAVSYAVGMLTPLSELFVPMTRGSAFASILSYFTFLAGFSIMAIGMSIFFDREIPKRALLTIVAVAIFARFVTWGGPRDSLIYEMAYQLPFAMAAFVSLAIILEGRARGPLVNGLAFIFGIITLHFVAKPFAAMALGSGATAAEYLSSRYALVSQSSSAILLVAAGLMILLVVGQRAILETNAVSETDGLSGLANRRGFELAADRVLARGTRVGMPCAIVLFDLDHFKQINDDYGHAEGDRAISAFGALLRETAPSGSVLARIGGEEFVMLIERATLSSAALAAEAVRIATAEMVIAGLPRMTVGAGVAEIASGTKLSEALRAADQALYRSKRGGRDRISQAPGGLYLASDTTVSGRADISRASAESNTSRSHERRAPHSL